MTLPAGPVTVNFAARIHPEARLAFDTCRLALRQHRYDLSDALIVERLCTGLDQKHIRLVLAHALTEVQTFSDPGTVNFAARIDPLAKLSFDGFVLEVRRTRPEIKYDYQVLEGLCLALELPYVQAVLWPWLTR